MYKFIIFVIWILSIADGFPQHLSTQTNVVASGANPLYAKYYNDDRYIYYGGLFEDVTGYLAHTSANDSCAQFDDVTLTNRTEIWGIEALFIQDADPLSTFANYEIRSGVQQGNGGNLISSGSIPIISIKSGQWLFSNYKVWNVLCQFPQSLYLDSGTYWITVRLYGPYGMYIGSTNGTGGIGIPKVDNNWFINCPFLNVNFAQESGLSNATKGFSFGLLKPPEITSGGLTTSPLTTNGLTTGAWTSSPIVTSGFVTSSPLTTSAVTTGVFVTTGAYTSADVTTSPLTTGEVTTGAITSGELTTSPLTSGDITTGLQFQGQFSAQATTARFTTGVVGTRVTSGLAQQGTSGSGSVQVTSGLAQQGVTSGSAQQVTNSITSGTSSLTTGRAVTTSKLTKLTTAPLTTAGSVTGNFNSFDTLTPIATTSILKITGNGSTGTTGKVPRK